jgi:hypothetical protein
MSLAAVAALAAGVVVTGVVISSTPERASAATVEADIYVDNATANCSDNSSASGSETTPFCTISAAAAVAQPGQAVTVEPGRYAPVTISVSGLPGKPITFQGATESAALIEPTGAANGFLVSAAHDVVISGFTVYGTNAPAYEVTGSSSDITINGGYTKTATSVPGLEIDDASDVTVSRGSFVGGAGVRVNSGTSGVVITGNTVHVVTPPAIAVSGVPGADISGNTLMPECGQGITASGGSAGASIENNIVSAWDPKASACVGIGAAITVASDSTAGTTADYNLIDPAVVGPLYDWGGTSYTGLATFQTATQQGEHDLYENPGLGLEKVTSTLGYGQSAWYPPGAPVIDSANADAPGELATDQLGNPRTDDPSAPNTGAGNGTGTSTRYFDRGAIEVKGPIAEVGVNAVPSGPLTITATQQVTTTWPTNGPIGIYAYDFDHSPFPLITTASTVRHTVQTAGAQSVGFEWSYGGGLTGGTSPDTVTIAGAGYTPVTPTRILDTRKGTGTGKAAPVPANGTLRLSLPSVGGIPATATTAVVMNVTVTQPAKAGYLTVFPGAGTTPKVSNLNFVSGQTVSNLVTVQVSGGKVSFHNASGGAVQLVADLAGYYGAAGNGFKPQAPVRVLDTRNGTGAAKAAVQARGRVRLNLAGKVPAGTAAVVLNVAVTQPRKAGWLAVTPDSAAVPGTSSINFRAGQTMANQVIVPLTNGIADLYNGSPGTLQVLADLDGYYASAAPDFFVPYGPVRKDDSRTNGQGPLKPFATYPLGIVRGDDGCFPGPACPQITAGVFNMTVTQPTRPGYLTVYPYGAARPAASSLDFAAGETIPNLVTTQVDASTAVSVYNGSAGTIQLVTDEYGYFIASS